MRRTKDGHCDRIGAGGPEDQPPVDTGSAPNQHTEAGSSQYQYNITPGYNIVDRDSNDVPSENGSSIDRNEAVSYLRDICGAKLKDDDIAALLSENNWKVDQAADKLLQLTLASSTPEQHLSTACTTASSTAQHKGLKLNMKTAKIPTQTDEPAMLPLLSPKTPHVVSNYLHYGENSTPDVLQPTMDALSTFGEGGSGMCYVDPTSDPFPSNLGSILDLSTSSHEVHGVGLTPIAGGPVPGSLFVTAQPSHDGPGLSTIIEHQRTESLSPNSQNEGHITSPGYNSGPSLIQEQAVSPSAMSAAFSQGVMSLTVNPVVPADNKNSTDNKTQTYMAQKPRGSRKKTLSLNPEEREALENLIEDVIMGGVASDESSNYTDSDEDGDKPDSQDGNTSSTTNNDGILNKEGLPKIYPAQLKVAVKHMRNLPPRFMRRLENAQKKIDAAERIEAERAREEQARLEMEAREREQERLKSREDQKREKKKEIRNLLEDLDQYTDEQSVLQNKETDQCECEDTSKTSIHQKIVTEHPKEVRDFMESSQPIHVGLSKAQNSQGVHSNPNLPNDLGQELIHGHNPSMPGSVSAVRAVNCEDLERELLKRADYGVPTSMPVFGSVQQTGANSSTSQNVLAHAFAGSHNPGDITDRRTFLSADAPEFVPLNILSYGQRSGAQTRQTSALHLQAQQNHQMQSSGSALHSQNPHLLLSSPHMPDAKFRSVPKDGAASLSHEMRQANASSPYSQSPVGRMSPQVVNNNANRSSPQLIPASGVDGPVPAAPTSQSVGKLSAFVVPKVPTSVPLPQPSAAPPTVPQHAGIAGVIPINPYQIPYSYATAAFPPQQGFPYQPFFPPTNYMAWNEGASDKLGPRGLIGHHPLIGVPLKASPQMARKRIAHQHSGPRPAAPVLRHNAPQPSKPPTDVKVLSAELAKKLLLQLLEEGKKVMVLLRGCPGSGKSSLAKEIVFSGTILSTDDYFVNSQGAYEYDKAKLNEAHMWNQNRAKQALEAGTNPIIIDNTNTQSWEMKSYVSLAQKQGYHIEIIEPDTPWRHNAKELAKRNIHGVTVSSIRKMLDLYEHSVTLASIMGVQTSPEKQTGVETQQTNQSEGEQQGQKTPHKRRRKKRKRKRHRSKKDKSGGQRDAQKHSSEDSSDDDDSTEKNSAVLFNLLEKRASLTSNETTTSPRETTPELVEKSELWEKTFTDIKEDAQHEQDEVPDGNGSPCQGSLDKDGTDVLGVERIFDEEVSCLDADDEEKPATLCSNLSAASHQQQDGDNLADVECGVKAVLNSDHGAINVICDNENVISSSENTCDKPSDNKENGDGCSGPTPSPETGNNIPGVKSDYCNRKNCMVESGTDDALQSQDCAQTSPETSSKDTSAATETTCKNLASAGNSKLDHLIAAEQKDSSESCDSPPLNNENTKCLSSVVPSGDTPSESCNSEANVTSTQKLAEEKHVLKREILDCLQDIVLHTVIEQELVRVLDAPAMLPDVMSELDESEEMHPTTLDDLRKALEDINYDNQVIDNDSDIDLDNEYGLEATGVCLNAEEGNVITGTNIECNSGKSGTSEKCVTRECVDRPDDKHISEALCDENNVQTIAEETVVMSINGSTCMEDDINLETTAKNCSNSADESQHRNVLSDVMPVGVTEKEKVIEVQYWMTKNTDAYSIPMTNTDMVDPVDNSSKTNEIESSHAEGQLEVPDFSLTDPKPKRERTGKKRSNRKSQVKKEDSGDTNMQGTGTDLSTLDEWTKTGTDGNHVDKQDPEVKEVSSGFRASPEMFYPDTVKNMESTKGISYEQSNSPEKLFNNQADSNRHLQLVSHVQKQLSQSESMMDSTQMTSCCCAHSQVEAKDLVFVHKLGQSDLEAVLTMDGFGIQEIRSTRPRDITGSTAMGGTYTEDSHEWICKIHRSCQTEEQLELGTSQQLQDKLIMLQLCFPHLSSDDIKHILEQCQGDVLWASNILLDSNPEQPEQLKQLESNVSGQDQASLEATDDCSTTSQGQLHDKHSSEEKKNAISRSPTENQTNPETLLMLCHKALMNHHAVCSKSGATGNHDCTKDLPSDHGHVYSGGADLSVSNTSESKQDKKLLLRLTKSFAEQLLEMFGPLQHSCETMALADDNIDVILDNSTAENIYKCWAKTLEQKSVAASGIDESDESLARRLQEEEYRQANISRVLPDTYYQCDDLGQGTKTKKKSHKKRKSFSDGSSVPSSCRSSPSKLSSRDMSPTKPTLSHLHNGITVNTSDRSQSPQKPAILTFSKKQVPVPSLREIMDEEMALEASIAEYLNCQNDVQANKDTLSTRLKWQQLIDRFPKVDQLMLYDVFLSTGFHMESTISAIERSLSLQGPPNVVMTPEAAEQFEKQMFQQAVEESLKMWPDPEDTPSKEDLLETLDDPVYSDFRAEALEHYKKRQECLQKAAVAYRNGMMRVASYYSQEGQLHYEKLREANQRAAETIVTHKAQTTGKSNLLDLHGLHVDEAIKALDTVITQREIEQREKPDKRKCHLVVVTGQGTHSRGGVAKVRPAVLGFLKNHNYRYTEISPSVVKVQLKYRDRKQST